LKKSYPVILIFLLLFASCNRQKEKRLHIDVSKIVLPAIKIHRYDVDLFKVSPDDLRKGLESIKAEYNLFLGTDLSDPKKLEEMRSYLSNERTLDFQRACEKKFKDLGTLEQDMTTAFKHIKYYYPEVKIPGVYSYISGGDYENPVQVTDSAMIIALDTYLGQDFKPYLADGVPLYKTLRMTPDHILPDCVKAMVDKVYQGNSQNGNFLGQMIEAGKKQYFVDAMLPDYPANLKIGYTPAQFDWITRNESHVWAAIIENRMLYSTDNHFIRAFMLDGPFTPEFSNESPPYLGEWIGWQIVKAYMNEQPDVSLNQLMQENDPQKILTLSSYKPGK
jgi:gliding motility-associated lipoprotein GldB